MARRDGGQPQRASCETVGTTMRAVVAKANSHRLTDIQHRVLLAVLSGTAAWTKLEDSTCIAEIAKLAGLEPDARGDHRSVRRALAKLVELHLITWEPASGRGKRSTIRLLGTTTPEMASQNGNQATENRTHRDVHISENGKPDKPERKCGHPGCPPTEKLKTEKLLAIAKSRQASRVSAREALPACPPSQDEERKDSWVGGEASTVTAHPATDVEAIRQSGAVMVADHELGNDDQQADVGTGGGAPDDPELARSLGGKLDRLGPVNPDVRRLVHELADEYPAAIDEFLRRAGEPGISRPGAWLHMVLPDAATSGELADLEASLERPTPMDEPQLLANARAFYTTFMNDYSLDAMRDELELRYPSLGSRDLELIVGTPVNTPPPPPERAKEQTTTLTPDLRAQLPWKLKVDQPPATHEELLHEQTELDLLEARHNLDS